MNALERAELTTLVHHIERFSKSWIVIYISKVPDMVGKKREGEEHRQLQKVMCFTETKKVL